MTPWMALPDNGETLQTRGHCHAPSVQTAGVIFNKIKAGIIKGANSDFLIRTKPRSNSTIMWPGDPWEVGRRGF